MAQVPEGVVFGCGNPLLDISSHVGSEVLEKYGLKPANAILAEPQHLPLYAELSARPDVEYIAGGATQNAIRVCQWMLQAPHATTYSGCVGNDQYAQTLEKVARQDGVNVLYMHTDAAPTGTCAVCVVGKERSMCANLGAANCFDIAHFQTAPLQEAIARAKIFYIAGFFLTVSPPSAELIAKHAAEHNKVFAMNLSAPFLIQFFGQHIEHLLPYMDFLFGNEDEAKVYAESKGWDGTDLKAVALKIAAAPKANQHRQRIVVFTRGSHSTLVASNGTVEEYSVDPLPAELLVDTNGAGDAFVGGFLAGLAKGLSMERCVLAGHYAARTIIQRSGCTFPPEPDFRLE